MRSRLSWFVLLAVVSAAGPAFAQGGGASSTGSISGEVVDESGGVLAGVTVIATSPAQPGALTATTNPDGLYRFPAVPPGEYKLVFERQGFGTLVREGIRVNLGFNAAVHVKLAVRQVEEEVTVTGESPVIDASATRIQVNYDARQLESLPNARDMWSLLATSPSVTLNRIDVGGSTMGTQTTYYAYGYGGQNRPLVEGINTTEGTAAAGFYFDYGSFDEVFIGTASNSAEMPHPGVLSQFVSKSGGNQLRGSLFFEYENEGVQSRNLSAAQLASGLRKDGNRLESYKNVNLNLGGPVVKDKVWWFFSYLRQQGTVAVPNLLSGEPFVTRLQNFTGKVTYQLSPRDKFIAYLQHGTKLQPNRLDADLFGSATAVHADASSALRQESPSWVGKVEWNHTFGARAFLELRAGQFGYNFPLVNNSSGTRYEDRATFAVSGGGRDWELRRRRDQFTSSLTYFVDNWLGGNHQVRVGGEAMDETGETIWNQRYTDNVVHILNNGAPQAVRLGAAPVDSMNGLRTYSAFLDDTWQIRRLTVNLGLRIDNYRVYLPAQDVPASRFVPQALSFNAVDEVIGFTHLAPRLGVTYDLGGNGRTVFKAAFGRYYFNPGVNLADAVNPNTGNQFQEWTWIDRNGDRLFQEGERGNLTSAFGGAFGGRVSVRIDPDLRNSYNHHMSVFVERELVRDLGARVGFVMKQDYSGYQRVNVARPFSAYTVPVTVVDPGPDGRVGTSDDGQLRAFNIDDPRRGVDNVVMNIEGYEGTYRTLELGINKRHSNRWSLVASFSHTWTREFAEAMWGNTIFGGASAFSLFNGHPGNPNDAGGQQHEYTNWNLKVHGSYEPGWGVRLTPVIRHQSGQPFGRLVTATLNYGSQILMAEPLGARRQPNITVVDVRAEKRIDVGERVKLGLFADVSNLLNANTAVNIRWAVGFNSRLGVSTFEAPTTVLAPRIVRFGAKLDF